MKIETLKDLRDFLNTLNDDQLSEQAYVQSLDELGTQIKSAGVLEEDYYIDREGEFSALVSQFEPLDDDDKLDNYEKLEKGTPWLSEVD